MFRNIPELHLYRFLAQRRKMIKSIPVTALGNGQVTPMLAFCLPVLTSILW